MLDDVGSLDNIKKGDVNNVIKSIRNDTKIDQMDNTRFNVVILAIHTRLCHFSIIIVHCTTSNYKEVSLTNVQMTNHFGEKQQKIRSNRCILMPLTGSSYYRHV